MLGEDTGTGTELKAVASDRAVTEGEHRPGALSVIHQTATVVGQELP